MKKFFKVIGLIFLATFVIGFLVSVFNPRTPEEEMIYELQNMNNELLASTDWMHSLDLYDKMDTIKKYHPDSLIIVYVDSIFSLKEDYRNICKQNHAGTMLYGAYYDAVEIIKKQLKAPSQSTFASYNSSEASVSWNGDREYYADIWVEAPNSFGVMLKKQWRVSFKESNNKLKPFDIKVIK